MSPIRTIVSAISRRRGSRSPFLWRPRWPGRIRVPNSLREMANCDRKHVGVTDRVLPAVGVSGLWGSVHPSRRNSGRYASRKGRLEGDQFLGDGFGFEQWGKVTDARQLSDVRVDDVLGHVAFHVGEEGAE
jgi:hypothetical protein